MLRVLLPVVCLLAAVLPGTSTASENDSAYLLNPGDTVEVSVWREDTLRQEVRVLPDGSITFPLAGRVDVAGLDSTAAASKVATSLKPYLAEPIVSVVIKATQGNLFYAQGKVLKPGSVQMSERTNVLQALSLAGGFDKFADTASIKVIRGVGAATQVLPVNYKDLISGRDMSTNIQLKAGDTLVVP